MCFCRVIAHRGQSTQELVQFWQIATQYQLYHSAAIVATAALPEKSGNAAAGGFLTGAQTSACSQKLGCILD